jgi:molecular chaperone DnaK
VETKVEEYQSQLPAEEVTKIRELIQKTRDVLAKKDELSAEEIRNSTNNLQQASLKLFELAYRKVSEDYTYIAE